MGAIMVRLATLLGTAWAGAYMAKSDDYDKGSITGWYESLPLIMRTTMWIVLVGAVMALINYRKTGKFSIK